LQNSTIEITNAANEVEAQSKAFTAVAVTVGDNFATLDETDHMLVRNAFA